MKNFLSKYKGLIARIAALLGLFIVLLFFIPLSHAFYFTLLAALVVFIVAKLRARKGIDADIHEVTTISNSRRTMPELKVRTRVHAQDESQSSVLENTKEDEEPGPVVSPFVQEVWEQKEEPAEPEAEPEAPLLEPSDFVKRVWREAAQRVAREEDALLNPDTLLKYTPRGFVPQILKHQPRKPRAKKSKPASAASKKAVKKTRVVSKPKSTPKAQLVTTKKKLPKNKH